MSKYIVFVGNNPNAREFQDYVNKNSKEQKNIAFGFQINGGRHENGRIINFGVGWEYGYWQFRWKTFLAPIDRKRL